MKKNLLFILVLILSINQQIYGQEILEPTNEKTYTEYMDKVLATVNLVDKNNFQNKILYDRVVPLANLVEFNKTSISNKSNYQHFMRSWEELYQASLSPDFSEEGAIADYAYYLNEENTVPIGIINTDFTYIDTTALKPTNPKLEIVNQKVQKISTKIILVD